jgi:hypothetical protein
MSRSPAPTNCDERTTHRDERIVGCGEKGRSAPVELSVRHALRGHSRELNGEAELQAFSRRISRRSLRAALPPLDDMRPNHVILATALLLLSACSDANVSKRPDSWTIATTPSMSIGLADGDSVYLFQRIADARLLPDGRIVVADERLLVLREYDRNGTFITQMGGKGSGPGEFQSLGDIWIALPDTIVAWDSRALRLTWFAGDRSLARTVSLGSANAMTDGGKLDVLAGALRDGSLVFGAVTLSSALGADRVTIENIGRNGDHIRRLAETTGLVRAKLSDKVNGPLPFSPYSRVATYGDLVYHTNGMESAVATWSPAGERTITFPPQDHDVEREWSAFAAHLERHNVQPFVRVIATAPRPERIPSLSGLLVDDAGRIWAKRYEPIADAIWLGGGTRSIGGTWWVADSAGRVVATVEVPAGFAPLQIENARVLGVFVDSLGVERVEIRTISR